MHLQIDNVWDQLVSALQENRTTFFIDEEPYGIHTLYPKSERWRHTTSDSVIFAEDDCGNWISECPRRNRLYFIDHETDATRIVTENPQNIVEMLVRWDGPALEEGQVISAWIDPDFLASLKKDEST